MSPEKANVIQFMESLLSASWIWVGDLLSSLFSPPLLTSLLGALAGSVGGAGIILYVERRRRQREDLAIMNAATASLAASLMTLLNIKKQIIIPQLEELRKLQGQIDQARALQARNEQTGIVQIELKTSLHTLSPFAADFLPTIERIARFADHKSKYLLLANKLQGALLDVSRCVEYRNTVVESIHREIQAGKSDNQTQEIILRCLNRSSNPTEHDNRLPSACFSLADKIDEAIFFGVKTIDALEKIASHYIPRRLRKSLMEFSIQDDETRALVPPDDYLDGW